MKGYGKWDYNYAIMQVIKFEYELFFFSWVLSTSWLEICIAQNGILITYGNNFETDLLKLRILPRITTWIC